MADQLDSQSRGQNDDWTGEDAQALFKAITLLQDGDEVRDFLLDLFTVSEIKNATKRWCIARVLFSGRRQVDARRKCNVDKNTASRAQRTIIEAGTGMSRIVYERLKSHDE
jgi:uncharacterized protein YerC